MTAPRFNPPPGRPPLLTPEMLAEDQTKEALEHLYIAGEGAIAFPHPPVHALVGRIAPGRLVFVAANTGQGKTTFLLDHLDRWAMAGVVLDYLGTEQEPYELRTKWAALRCGVPAGVAVNGEWDLHPEGEEWQMRMGPALGELETRFGRQVLFHPEKFVTLPLIERACADAYRRGAQLLVIDHVDRIDVGVHEAQYAATLQLIRRLKELARDCNLVLVAASQMNRKSREGDRLAAYRPPQLHHMQGGGMKEQEADVVLGLWRPIRQPNATESADEYAKILRAAREGAVPPSEFVEPDTMGVVVLKHRTWGNREGERCKLRVHRGRLEAIPEKDTYATTRDGIRTREPQR